MRKVRAQESGVIVKKFCIIANKEKDINHEVAKKIKTYLETKGIIAIISENASSITAEEGFQMAVVLGGDGTMIQAAKDLAKLDISIMGVNLGTLGFLTEIEKDNLFPVLDEVITDDYMTQKRIALRGTAVVSGKTKDLGLAVNDFIIGKRGFGRIITISVHVNSELVDEYVADGILISTPTGSTAYNLSAGGPILSPEMEAMIITPICPHSLNKRSIVVSANDSILVKVGQTRKGFEDLATISGDGKLLSEAQTSDTIKVEMSNHRIEIVRINQSGFFERMRKKLNRY